ncbi:MAG TPA: hypothetical protein PKI46_00330 [Bacteroidales bacterium]|nr:hypothetical protein [Bacteroidales bacterium]
MRKIYYDTGSPTLSIMELGKFTKGIPKEVTDDVIADLLVKRGQFKYWVEPEPELIIEKPKKKLIKEV